MCYCSLCYARCYFIVFIFSNFRAGEKTQRQVDFGLGQVKMEVSWSGGEVKLASIVLLVDKA